MLSGSYIHKFKAWKMTTVMEIHFRHKAALYIFTPAVKKRLVTS
jgi:hypothetical protein